MSFLLLNLKILRAESKQAEQISNMILPLAIEHFKPIIASFSSDSIASLIDNPAFNYYIAIIDDALCGIMALRDNKHIYHLFVTTKYQRRGIARRLWEHAKLAAEQLGNEGVFTVNSSMNAVQVYQHLGFNIESTPQEKNGVSFIPMQYGG